MVSNYQDKIDVEVPVACKMSGQTFAPEDIMKLTASFTFGTPVFTVIIGQKTMQRNRYKKVDILSS